jgi:hypothetical protein
LWFPDTNCGSELASPLWLIPVGRMMTLSRNQKIRNPTECKFFTSVLGHRAGRRQNKHEAKNIQLADPELKICSAGWERSFFNTLFYESHRRPPSLISADKLSLLQYHVNQRMLEDLLM